MGNVASSEISKCLACDSLLVDGKYHEEAYPNSSRNADAPSSILMCDHCGLGVASPLLSDVILSRLYDGGRAEFWSAKNLVLSARQYPVPYGLAFARWSLIETHLAGMGKKEITVLDVGAGYGFFGVLASQSTHVEKLKYIAVEPDESLHQAISDMWKSTDSYSSVQTFCRIEDVEGKVDILVLSHVLEHVKNPLDFLGFALGYLKSGGMLFIDVPFHDQQFKSDVFPHLYFFSPTNLSLILKKLKLDVIDVDVWGHQFKDFDSLGFWKKGFIFYLDRLVHFMLNCDMPLRIGVRYFLKRYGMVQRIKGGAWVRALARKPL